MKITMKSIVGSMVLIASCVGIVGCGPKNYKEPKDLPQYAFLQVDDSRSKKRGEAAIGISEFVDCDKGYKFAGQFGALKKLKSPKKLKPNVKTQLIYAKATKNFFSNVVKIKSYSLFFIPKANHTYIIQMDDKEKEFTKLRILEDDINGPKTFTDQIKDPVEECKKLEIGK